MNEIEHIVGEKFPNIYIFVETKVNVHANNEVKFYVASNMVSMIVIYGIWKVLSALTS